MRNFLSSIKNSTVQFMHNRHMARSGLKIEFFNESNSTIEQALQELPEMEECPHELYQLLLQKTQHTRKKIALILEGDTPVAVVGLRYSYGRWEPVTQWIIPGVLFPVKNDYLERSLAAIGLNLYVAFWRTKTSPPLMQEIRHLESIPTYKWKCNENFESYWRKTHHFKTIKRARKRCQHFQFEVNAPGSAEWVIRNWEAKWRSSSMNKTPGLEDRLVAADYLESKGRYFTLVLLDKKLLIGGASLILHRNELVGHTNYRRPEYNSYEVGHRLIDLSFYWAMELGVEKMDIGGGFPDYKKRWAPEDGRKWTFNICPGYLRLAKQADQFVVKLRQKIRGLAP